MSVMPGPDLSGGLNIGASHGGWNSSRYPNYDYPRNPPPPIPPTNCCDYYCCFRNNLNTTCPCPGGPPGGPPPGSCNPGDPNCGCGCGTPPGPPDGGPHPQPVDRACTPPYMCILAFQPPLSGLAAPAVPGSSSTYSQNLDVAIQNVSPKLDLAGLWISCAATGVTQSSVCGSVTFYHTTSGTKSYTSSAGPASRCDGGGVTAHAGSASADTSTTTITIGVRAS